MILFDLVINIIEVLILNALFKKNVANWINTNILKANQMLKKNIFQIMIKISIKVGVYNDYWKTSCSIFEK